MADRLLELRVHGVSNTPPADILGMRAGPGSAPGTDEQPWLVAGDAVTGFYRAPHPDPTDPVTVEAYSWGQLTSGARAARDVERALWTVLLPFTLANVALHARPDIPADPREERWNGRPGIAAWLIRLFCLSLTATLVLAATGIGVDLIGWQCVDDRCLSRLPGPWEFLASGWWAGAAHSLAVGLLVPFGLLTVLGLLTWRTYQYEAEIPLAPTVPADPGPVDSPLRDPTFWCGAGQVRRLAVAHLTVGAAVAAAVPLGAVILMDPPHGARAALAWTAATALALTGMLAVALLGHPWATRRGGDTPIGRYGWLLVGLAAVGVAGAVALLLLPDSATGVPLREFRPPADCATRPVPAGCLADRSLPGYDRAVAALATAQVLLLVAVAGVARTGRSTLVAPAIAAIGMVGAGLWYADLLPLVPAPPDWLPGWAVGGAALLLAATVVLLPACVDPHPGVAWGRRGPAVLAGLGWLLGNAYSAGLLYWITNRLNQGTPADQPVVIPPVPVTWAGLTFVGVLLAGAATLARAGTVFVELRNRCHAELAPPQLDLTPHERRRARDVATFRALHELVGEHALRLVGGFSALAVGLGAAGAVAALSGVPPVWTVPGTLTALVSGTADLGNALLGWLPVLIFAIGLLVYRNDTVRRSVGIVWDIGTFWPRGAHPLAPPSYAERAVPQLQTRAAGLMALAEDDPRRMDGLILSGHSQGAVISTAVILQLPPLWCGRIWFFSYGCQLSRLYGRVFPAYFGPDRLPALTAALTDAAGTVRWTNFWRPTDPLGWPVEAGERNLRVHDPESLHPSDGEVRDPPIRNHSGYPETVEYQRERSLVVGLLTGPVLSPGDGSG